MYNNEMHISIIKIPWINKKEKNKKSHEKLNKPFKQRTFQTH